jgi:hypothetical protein
MSHDFNLKIKIENRNYCNGCKLFIMDNGTGSCMLGHTFKNLPFGHDNAKPAHERLLFWRPDICKENDTEQ